MIGCNKNAYAAAIDEVVSPNGFCLFLLFSPLLQRFGFASCQYGNS